MRVPGFLLLSSAGTALLLSWQAHAASFDCAKASTTVEKAICSNVELSTLDDRLSAAYKAALADALDPASIKTSQREWTKARNACQTVSCLQKAYSERIAVLGNDASAMGKTRTITGTIMPPGQTHGDIESSDNTFSFEMGGAVADTIFEACKVDDLCRVEAVIDDDGMIIKVLSVTRASAENTTIKPSTKTEGATYTGKVEEYRDAGMWFFRLIDPQGKEIVSLGARGVMPEVTEACLGEAIDEGSSVHVGGTLLVYADGSRGMDEKTLTCKAGDASAQSQTTTVDFWVQRGAQERKDEIILGLCINETDDCGNMVIKKGSQPFSVYQQNRGLFKTGLIFRATFDQHRVITAIAKPFPLESPAPLSPQVQLQQSAVSEKSACDEAERKRLMELYKGELAAYVGYLKAAVGDYPTMQQQLDMGSKINERDLRAKQVLMQADVIYQRTKNEEEACRALRTLVGEMKRRP